MAYLKIGRSRVYKLLQDGTIPAFRIGKSWRIDREEVDAWIRSQRAIPSTSELESEPPLEPEIWEYQEDRKRSAYSEDSFKGSTEDSK